MGMAAVMASTAPDDDARGPLLLVFTPGTPFDAMTEAAFAAGGGPVRNTALPFAIIAASDTPGYAGRLRSIGRGLVLGAFPFGPELMGCAAYPAQRPWRLAPVKMLRETE